MLHRLLGFLILMLGIAQVVGASQLIQLDQFETILPAVLPGVHIWAGLALLALKQPGRYLVAVLSVFYLCLGILSFKGVLIVTDFLPVVPLIEYVPISVLEWDFTLVSIVTLFVLPLLALFFARSKPAPYLVIFAGAFSVAYSFLTMSQVDLVGTQEPQVIFGFVIMETLSRIVSYLKFLIPICVGFGAAAGIRVAWFCMFAVGGIHWLPFFQNWFSESYFSDFEFLFFGFGWIAAVIICLIFTKYFWRAREEKLKLFPSSLSRLVALTLVVVGLLFISFNESLKAREEPPEISAKMLEAAKNLDALAHLINLTGTTVSPDGSLAIVNNKVMQIGDVVGEHKIEAIEPNRILISRDGHRQWLDSQGNLDAPE